MEEKGKNWEVWSRIFRFPSWYVSHEAGGIS